MALNSVVAFWRAYVRTLREIIRLPMTLIVVPLVLPLFMLIIFSRVFERLTSLGAFGQGNYITYMAPAAILMASMLASAGAGVSTAVDRQTGFYDRLRITPIGSVPSHWGRRAGDATRIATFAMTLTFFAWLNGAVVNNWLLALVVPALAAALWGMAYGGILFSVCLKTGSAEAYQALLPLFFPILFMSSAFVPAQLLPHWLEVIASGNPISYISTLMRSAAKGNIDWHATAISVLGTACVFAATQLLTYRAGRRVANA